MATVIKTIECYPRPIMIGDFELAPAGEAQHEHCSGGQGFPGLIGGWVCPCPCHHTKDPVEEITKLIQETTTTLLEKIHSLEPYGYIPDGLPEVEFYSSFEDLEQNQMKIVLKQNMRRKNA